MSDRVEVCFFCGNYCTKEGGGTKKHDDTIKLGGHIGDKVICCNCVADIGTLLMPKEETKKKAGKK